MKFHLETKIALGLVVTFMLVVAGNVLTYINSSRAIDSAKSVSSGLQLVATLESLFDVLRSVDKLSVDYAEHGEQITLAQFNGAIGIVKAHTKAISSLKKFDDRCTEALLDLQPKVEQLVKKSTELVRSRERSKSNLVISNSIRKDQENLLNSIGRSITLIESEERMEIALNNKVNEEHTASLFHTYALLGPVSIFFFFGLIAMLVRYIRSERNTAESQQKVAHEIVAHAPIGVLILDQALRVVSFNPTFKKYVDADREDAIKGKNLLEILPGLPESTVQALSNLQIDTIERSEMNLQLKDTEIRAGRYWDMAIWPVMDDAKLKGIVVLIVDVTERLSMSSQRQLLFNTFAHDLKNPIVGNQYLIKALLSDSTSSSRKDALEALAEGNEDALKIIKNILELSKLQNGKEGPAIKVERFNLQDLLLECVGELSKMSRLKHVEIKCQFCQPDVEIESDKIAVKHLALNLLENAVKFSDEGAEVELVLGVDNAWRTLSVHNSGPGLSEEERMKLFSTFGQGELGRRSPGGSGIGLYLCGQLVEVLGGTLKCESSLECGTTFVASLPESISGTLSKCDDSKEGIGRTVNDNDKAD